LKRTRPAGYGLTSTWFWTDVIAPINIVPLRFGEMHRTALLSRQSYTFHRGSIKIAVDERRSAQICAVQFGVHKHDSFK
jgi:hypothetical protein